MYGGAGQGVAKALCSYAMFRTAKARQDYAEQRHCLVQSSAAQQWRSEAKLGPAKAKRGNVPQWRRIVTPRKAKAAHIRKPVQHLLYDRGFPGHFICDYGPHYGISCIEVQHPAGVLARILCSDDNRWRVACI